MTGKSAAEILNENTFTYASKGFPPKFKPDNYKVYRFSLEQFKTACTVVSGNCSELVENPLGFILQREEDLAINHNEGYSYCDFGFVLDDAGIVHIWYKTTSGTVLSHSFDDKEDHYECYLPNIRLAGYHNMLLDMIDTGMSLTQYTDWYNCECFPEKQKEYREKQLFWNNLMVPLGYPTMPDYKDHWEKMNTNWEKMNTKKQKNIDYDYDYEADCEYDDHEDYADHSDDDYEDYE